MGMFSFLDKPFRTGRTAASKDAKRATQNREAQFDEMLELFKPSIEQGQSFLGKMGAYFTPSGMNNLYNDVQGSDFVNSLTNDRMRTVDNVMGVSGLRRSGTRLAEAAKVPTDVITSIMDKITGGTQNVASIGLGQGGNMLGALTGGTNAALAGAEYGMIPGNNKASMFGGLLSLGGQLGSAALLSDERLKTNITKIGEYGPLNVYEWDWIDDRLGMVMTTGFIAQEVQEIFPQHIHPIDIDGFEMLGVDYESVMEEVESVH